MKTVKEAKIEFLNNLNANFNKMTKKEQEKFANNLNHKDLYELNKYILEKTENPKYSCLKIMEPGRLGEDEENIFEKFPNLYEFSESWKQFQIEAEKGCLKNGVGEFEEQLKGKVSSLNNVELYLTGDWIRYIEKLHLSKKKVMKYASLYSLEDYIYQEIEEYFNKWLNKNIPFNFFYVYNVELFQKTEDKKHYRMADSEIRAAGREKELEEIKNKWYSEDVKKIEVKIREKIAPYSGMVFRRLKEVTGKWEDHMQYDIIGGKEAAKKITFKTYLYDLYELEQPYGIVKNIIKDLKKEIKKEYLNNYIK